MALTRVGYWGELIQIQYNVEIVHKRWFLHSHLAYLSKEVADSCVGPYHDVIMRCNWHQKVRQKSANSLRYESYHKHSWLQNLPATMSVCVCTAGPHCKTNPTVFYLAELSSYWEIVHVVSAYNGAQQISTAQDTHVSHWHFSQSNTLGQWWEKRFSIVVWSVQEYSTTSWR